MSDLVIAFWATPVMTVGHALFAFTFTSYILVGIWFEERVLLKFIGKPYEDYRNRVPMLIPGTGRSESKDQVSKAS